MRPPPGKLTGRCRCPARCDSAPLPLWRTSERQASRPARRRSPPLSCEGRSSSVLRASGAPAGPAVARRPTLPAREPASSSGRRRRQPRRHRRPTATLPSSVERQRQWDTFEGWKAREWEGGTSSWAQGRFTRERSRRDPIISRQTRDCRGVDRADQILCTTSQIGYAAQVHLRRKDPHSPLRLPSRGHGKRSVQARGDQASLLLLLDQGVHGGGQREACP